jgi:hypothetical protein
VVKSKWNPIAVMDRERRTCIAVDRSEEIVKYIPLDIESGLVVLSMSTEEFDNRYRPMLEYPVEKAAALYASYARTIGATQEAMSFLSPLTDLTQKEIDMAVAKKKDTTKAAEEKKTAAKTASKKATPAKTKKPETPKTEKPEAPKGDKQPKASRETAAQMFQDLIMAGKLSDDQIFAKVQEKFGLDDKKKGYVKWYRNHLKKQGKKPPEPKS